MADLSDFELINFGGLPTVSPSGTHHLMLDNGAATGKNTINNIVAAAQATQDNAAAIAANATAIAANATAISLLNSNIGNIRYAQYAVSGGSSRSITLATWAVYLVSTFLGFHVVFTGSSSYTPVIETVRGNSSLPVTSEASATIVLGNTTGSTYQFSVIRIL